MISSSYLNDVQYVKINTDQTLRAWASTATAVFLLPVLEHTSTVYNNYLYVLGGRSSGGVRNDVQYVSVK